MKNRKKLKIGTLTFALAVVFSSMLFSVPAYAIRADEIPTGTPVIDGVMEELWNGASNKIAIEMTNEGDAGRNATGYARMMWDSQYLYVLGYVNDRTLSTYEPTDSTWWASDSFEIFLDERNAHNTVKNEISQIRVSRQGTLSGMLMSTAVNREGVLAEYGGTKWAAKNVGSSGDYVIELAIPWTRISSPSAGTQIGTEFQINDVYDGASKTSADGVINSEVIDVWQCGTYRMMTLSAAKVDDGNTSDPNGGGTDPNGGATDPNGGATNPNGGATDPNGGATDPNGGATDPNGGVADPNGGATDPNGATTDPNGGATNPSGGDKTDSSNDKKDPSSDKKDPSKDNVKEPAEKETSDSILKIVTIIVAVVVFLVVAGCVAVIIISKKRRK